MDAIGSPDPQGVRPGAVSGGDAGPGEVHAGTRGRSDGGHENAHRRGRQDVPDATVRSGIAGREDTGFVQSLSTETDLRYTIHELKCPPVYRDVLAITRN